MAAGAGAGFQHIDDAADACFDAERRAYTLDAAARALGLSRRMIAYYEKGERPIPRVVALATRALEAAE